MKQDVFGEMVARWPSAIVARHQAGKFSGGLVSPGTLANLDSRGKGPAQRILMGTRRVGYPAAVLADWLRGRCAVVGGEGEQ